MAIEDAADDHAFWEPFEGADSQSAGRDVRKITALHPGCDTDQLGKRMKGGVLLKACLCIFSCFAMTGVFAAPAPSADVPLNVPDGFSAYSITPIGKGLYCVAGGLYHDEVPNESATVVLVDTNEHRVVWKTDIPYSKKNFENTAFGCVSDGVSYYALTQERTNSAAELSQSELVLSRISTTGKLLAQRRVNVGRDEWANLFEAGVDGLSIVGGTSSDAVDHGGKLSLFVARFDSNLTRKRLITLPTGAFWTGTRARLDGYSLLIAGQFDGNAGAASSGCQGYAVSKIDLDRQRYVWSTFVYPLKMPAEAPVFLRDGRVAYVGLSGDHLLVSIVDGTGKMVRQFSGRKTICSIEALGVKGSVLQAVGASCGNEHSTTMLDIDLTNGDVVSSRHIGDDTKASLFDGDALVSIAGRGHRQVFRRSGR